MPICLGRLKQPCVTAVFLQETGLFLAGDCCWEILVVFLRRNEYVAAL